MDLDPPEAVRELTRRLEAAGYDTWAVGGVVRDAVLGRGVGDWDLATRARPEQVRRLFRRTVPIGVEHGTVGVLGADGILYEVTTFRRDVETFGRHAVVEFATSVDEDLARRDFTINALAWHPLTGELRDPYGGADDLRAGRLRTVGRPQDRFAEDYLRVLRALRFAGQFGLTIEPTTWRALAGAAPHLSGLSAERVREELWKVLTRSRPASRALSLYAASGALAVLYPELEATIALDQDSAHAPDAWAEALFAVDALPPNRPLLRVAALLHAIGRPAASPADFGGTADTPTAAEIGATMAETLLRRLKASNAETERVVRLVRHQSELVPVGSGDADLRRWLRRVGPDLVTDLFRLRFALWRATCGDVRQAGTDGAKRPDALVAAWTRARAMVRSRPPLEVADLAIGGRELMELGVPPGPRMGQILRALLDRVLEQPALNRRDALLDLARQELEA